jgi:hypothetical protein
LTVWAGSPVDVNWLELNGLRSKACVMLFPVEVRLNRSPHHGWNLNAGITHLSPLCHLALWIIFMAEVGRGLSRIGPRPAPNRPCACKRSSPGRLKISFRRCTPWLKSGATVFFGRPRT